MTCTAFVVVWVDEGLEIVEHLGDDCETVIVSAATLAKTVNELLPGLSGLVAVINGVTMSDGWVEACEHAMTPDQWVASPFVLITDAPRAWYEPVSPFAFVCEARQLEQAGGLDERLSFGQNVVVAKRAGVDNCIQVPEAVASPLVHQARTEALGANYYRMLEDKALADSL